MSETEFIDRRVRDIALKLKESDGKLNLSAMRLLIEGYTGTHITSFFHNEEIHCDCTAYGVYKQCVHMKVAEILKYVIESILPTLEVEKLFEKAKEEKR